MKLTKLSNYVGFNISKPEDYIRTLDIDLNNIFLAFKGRVRFGSVGSATRGENIEGEFEQFTTAAFAGSSFAVAHSLGAIPVGWLEVSRNAPVVLAKGTSAWTSTNAYFTCNSGSVGFSIFLMK